MHRCSPVLDDLGEGLATVGLLVQGLVEEDDATDAVVDLLVGGEKELAVQPPVLLSVLCVDALEALGHAACGGQSGWRGAERKTSTEAGEE